MVAGHLRFSRGCLPTVLVNSVERETDRAVIEYAGMKEVRNMVVDIWEWRVH